MAFYTPPTEDQELLQSPVAPVATSATPATAYKDLNLSPYDATADQNLNRFTLDALAESQPFNEKNVFRSKMRDYQTEVNAQNRLFAQELDTLRADKQAIVGRARAAEAAGVGGYGGVMSAQRQANRPIDTLAAQQEAKIESIMNNARAAADAEVQAKRAARQQGYANYVSFLKETDTRKATNAQNLAQTIIDQDLTLDEIDPKALSEAARSYGITEAQLRSAYMAREKELADEAREQEFNEAKEQLEYDEATGTYKSTAPVEPVSLGDGAYLVDPTTGKIIAENEQDFAPTQAPGKFAEYEYGVANGYISDSYEDWMAAGGGSAEVTNKQKDTYDKINVALSGLKEYRNLYDKLVTDRAGSQLTGDEAGQLRAAHSTLLFQIAAAAGTGALQAPDREVVEKMIPDPTSVTGAIGRALRGGKAGGLTSIDQAIKMYENASASIGKGAQGAVRMSPEERQQLINEGYDPGDGSFSGVGNTTASTKRPLVSGLQRAFALIKKEEGLRTEAYQDQTGKWTIGFGNTIINGRPVRPGDRITTAQALNLMQDSVIKNYTNFTRKVGTALPPNKFAALTSFEYNLGPGIWKDPTANQILANVSRGNFAAAGRLMLQFNKSRDPSSGQLKVNPVLAKRRQREAGLLLS